MDLPTFLATEMDNSLFFSTLATTSTVFIIVMATFAIHRVSTINTDKHIKNHEKYDCELEISKLKADNEKNQLIIDKIITPGSVITHEQRKEWRKCAQTIIQNNLIIEGKKRIIDENDKILKDYEHTKTYLNKSTIYLYFFVCLYIFIPLILLSLPNSAEMVIYLNFIKLALLISMLLFVIKIIKDCRDNLLFPDILEK